MESFNEIDFGSARAEWESANNPTLIKKGFFDPNEIVNTLLNKNVYLILGHKGSGKSAIAEKVRLESTFKTKSITSIIHLSDFPFTSFSKVMDGKEEPQAKFPITWSWLLLISLLGSFSKDQSSPTQYDSQFMKAISSLTELGFLPPDDLCNVVTKSSKRSFKIEIPKFLQNTFDDTKVPAEMDMQFRRLVDHLKQLIFQFKSENNHILVIDGLDDILLRKEIQYLSLAALVYETDRLNLDFIQNSVRAKIILVCRTDLFERLPGPNKNKIRQDSAHEIDWYHDPRNPGESSLVKLINLRAGIHFHKDVNIFSTFFPKEINNSDAITFLLEKTRHTPRDFIQLLNHLKDFYRGDVFANGQILSGVRSYSTGYFLPEIRDELAGYIPTEHVEILLGVIRSLRKREFSYRELLMKIQATRKFEVNDLDSLLNSLYECSAIGNKWQLTTGEFRYEFKYRNPSSVLNNQNKIVLHRGLWYALNLE
jgi:hypothetical protein